MFYLGFSDCASAELCFLVCFSFMFYYFHAKKDPIYRLLGGRPVYSNASVRGEVSFFDYVVTQEAFFSQYGDIVEYSSLYEYWFHDPDAIEDAVEHIQSTINRDNSRKELRKFIENEVTERWFIIYRKYYDPKYT